ncbi:MAG TPA: BatA and WFA domain-containing protein [Blastocatellia bacterium]|nr:BatA and WFA domain-containing protein [Blastocatellia bacterium]
MSFAFPLALFGLLAVPALVAIYWLRNRSRRRVVSSLMLWMDQHQLKEGGLLIHRLQTPLLFFLELLSILLIVLAAAGPMVRAGEGARPLVIVLDDSFSMLAGGEDSPRHQAEEAVKKELRSAGDTTTRIVLAGETPQILGEATGDRQQTGVLLDQWKCFSPGANLEEAITFAFAIGGERSRTVVVTDHPPSAVTETARLEWRAFGRHRSNIAFVNATRTARDGQDRCMLEIANLSDKSAKTELVVESGTASGSNSFRELRRSPIDLAANGVQRVVLTLAPGAGALHARIGTDSLALDNEVTLLPGREQPVRVEIGIRNDSLREIVDSAIRATGAAEMVSSNPELLLTDEADRASSPRSWVVRITADQDAESYLGPFVVDRNHPLTEGLALDGVIWGASKSTTAAGSPVIMAGNISLVSDLRRADGAREVRLSFRPELSTLQRSPAWPVLMWNLLSWRASELPGVSQSNVRLGSDAKVKLPPGVTAAEVSEPGGTVRQMTALDRTVSLRPEAPGIYEITAAGERYLFASNALRKEESDLSASASGRWGSLDDAAGAESELRSIGWVFLLLLMLALSLHLALASRGVTAKQV